MRWYAKERAVERVARAAASGLDLLGFWTEARGVLASAIPHHITPCWYTLDPASLLVTGHYDHGMISELPPQWLAHEYAAEDCHKLADVVQGPAALSTLHDATGGDPSRSPRWQRFIEPYGGDQELLLPLRAATREVWGVLALYRAPGQPAFDVEERELLTALAPHLAEGARRGLLVGEAREPEQPEAPGLVVLDEHFEIDSLTPAVERWLRELPGGRAGTQQLPQAVISVAGRAFQATDVARPSEVAFARVLAQTGRWVALHGALLQTGRRRVAVIVEPAHPARISPLLMAAYGLTNRAQDIARSVLGGLAHSRDCRHAPDLAAHRPAAPEGDLRKDRCEQPPRARRKSVLRPLRAASARQRATCTRAATAPGWPSRDPV